MPANSPMLKLVNVSKTFNQQRVLDNINLSIAPGQITVIVGPSGTGKSVLIKHFPGLLTPDSGQVWFQDQQVCRLSDKELVKLRMRMGFLFQLGALFDSMNVMQNVCFPLAEHTDMNLHQQKTRCLQVLALVGLPDVADQMPSQLSGGQRKRVALARAIVLKPEVIFYDEPTTGLDPITSDIINELILGLSRHLGCTSVVVTHDMTSVRKIADRVIMLQGGRIIADGDLETFLATSNEYVQRFIRGQAEPDELETIRLATQQ